MALLNLAAVALFSAVRGAPIDVAPLLSGNMAASDLQFTVTLLPIVTVLAFILGIWLAGRYLDRRRFADFGFHFNRRWWLDFAFGLGLGALLMVLIFLVEWAAGWLTVTGTFQNAAVDTPFAVAILTPLVLFFCVGIYEELWSRGYQLKNMAEGLHFLGARPAIVLATLITAAVFGALHATNPNATLISTFNLFLAGIFLALGYILTGELAISIGLHMTWNFFQGNVFGFPVSGTGANQTTFIAIEQGGNPLITGGAFGPEAGLIGIGAMVIGSVLIVLWVRRHDGTVGAHTALATPELLHDPTPAPEPEHPVMPDQVAR